MEKETADGSVHQKTYQERNGKESAGRGNGSEEGECMTEEYIMYVIKEYEKKLQELMGEDFTEFAHEVCKQGFRKEMEQMAESEFKDFILDNFDDITRL